MAFKTGLLLLLLSSSLYADEYRNKANVGFDYYKNGEYDKAVEYYRQAGILNPDKALPKVGKGAALYRSNDLEGAAEEFESAAGMGNNRLAADMRYNIGNTKYKAEDYKGAIESYVEALKLNSDDIDYKHNLEMALSRLQEQQQQEQDQEGDQDQQNQDQQKSERQQDEQKRDQNDQRNEDQQKDQEQNQRQTADEKKMSEEEAENLLARFEEDEKEIQERLKQINIRGSSKNDW